MTVQRLLCTATLAAGIGLTSLVGTGVATAHAAPVISPIATTKETPDPQPIPGVDLSHHDQKKLKKYLKEHPEATLPNTGQH